MCQHSRDQYLCNLSDLFDVMAETKTQTCIMMVMVGVMLNRDVGCRAVNTTQCLGERRLELGVVLQDERFSLRESFSERVLHTIWRGSSEHVGVLQKDAG
jgi:hypothetical protein